jgi:hypothetical protein
MNKSFSSIKRAYLAGFLDGDGSIYARLKPNPTYKYGFQVAPYIVFFQSQKSRVNFEKICLSIGLGHLRERNDGILEYIISRHDAVIIFLDIIIIKPYTILKKEQVSLMIKILKQKEKVRNKSDFNRLAQLIDEFRNINYSKKRKIRKLTP